MGLSDGEREEAVLVPASPAFGMAAPRARDGACGWGQRPRDGARGQRGGTWLGFALQGEASQCIG